MKKILLLLSSAAIFSSCGIYTNYHRPESVNTENLTGNMVIEESSDSLLSWKDFFTDTKLTALIEKGLEQNTNLKSAELKVEQVRAALVTSRLAFFPTLALTPNGALSSFDGGKATKTYNAGASASWQLDVFGSLRNANKGAKTSYELTKVYKEAVQSQLIATIANSYYSLSLLDEQLKVSEETSEIWKRNVEIYKVMMEAGLCNQSAVSQAESNYMSIMASVEDLRKAVTNSENDLCSLLGETPHSIERADWKSISIDNMNFTKAGVPLHLLASRPDVRQSELALATAFYTTNQARSAFYPNITLSGSAGWTNSAGAMIVNPGKVLLSAVGSLTQPIFQGGKIAAQYKISKLQQEDAKNSFQQTLLNAGVEVNSILTQIQAADKKADYYEEQKVSLEKVLNNSKLLMENGHTTYLEVLTAQQSLLSASLNDLSNEYDQLQGYILLYQALGGGVK